MSALIHVKRFLAGFMGTGGLALGLVAGATTIRSGFERNFGHEAMETVYRYYAGTCLVLILGALIYGVGYGVIGKKEDR